MVGSQILGWATVVLLASVRLSMLFLSTPVFGGVPIPVVARMLLVVGLAAGMVHGVALPAHVDAIGLASMLLHEAIVGGALAAGLFMGFSAFQFGGRLLDFQIGYGVAGLVDIATKNNAPLLGSLLSMMAVLVFFTVDGHLVMLRIVELSLREMPPGGSLSALNLGALIAQFASCFVFGFLIVAPIVVCLLLIDFGTAFMSRTMPQMNVFVLSMSIKVIVGATMLAIVVPLSGGVVNRIFESIFDGWSRLLG